MSSTAESVLFNDTARPASAAVAAAAAAAKPTFIALANLLVLASAFFSPSWNCALSMPRLTRRAPMTACTIATSCVFAQPTTSGQPLQFALASACEPDALHPPEGYLSDAADV